MTYDPKRPTGTGSTGLGNTGTQREFERPTDQGQSTFENVRDKAQDVAGDVKDRAQQIGSQVADRADAATTTVGERMTDAAQTLRERAPATGTLGNAADTAADTLERAGTYLQQQDLNDIRGDLENMVRRYPMQSLLIGLGIGYLLARSTRR